MTDEAEPILLWVRNEQAKVYGPLSPTSVELLIDNGVLIGRLQVSVDGLTFVFPGRLPGPRMVFPRSLWGDVVVEGEAEDAVYSRVVLPPPIPDVGVPQKSPAPKAPGRPAEASRAPGGVPVAGPAARMPPPSRPVSSHGQPVGSSDSAVRAHPGTPAPQRPGGSPAGAPPQPPSVAVVVPPTPRPTIPSDGPPAGGPPSRSVQATPVPASHGSGAGLPASGSLSECSPMRLYGLAAATEASALLELALSDRTILVHFKRGAPELIDSTHPHDALPAFLMAQGLATPAQLEQAEAQKGRFGGELLPALFGLGLVNPNLVFQQIAERATAILFRALSAEQGTFTFKAQELPPHKSLPLGNRWALYLEQLRRIAPADVRRRMAGFMGLPVMRSGGAVAVADLKLQPQEARALQFFDGVRSLNQLVGDHPMEADVLVRVAWMLRELDLVTFDGTPALARPSVAAPGAIPPPSVAPPAVPVVSTPSVAPFVEPQAGAKPANPATVAPPPMVPSVAARAMAPPSAPSFIGAPVAPPGAPPAHRPLVARTVLRVAEPSAPPTIKTTMAGGPVPVQPPPRQAVPSPERRGPGSPTPSTAPPSNSSARPAGTASSPSGVAKAPTPPPGVVPTNDIAQLTALLDRARKQTYFELLNLSREADATAAKAAYFRLAKLFHPDTVPPGSSEALARVKAELFALIGEAYRTLIDPRLKQDYIAEVDSGSQGEKVDVAQLLLAEELFQRGRMLVKARKWAEAVKVLNEAIAANGQEGEYFGWRGFARFFLHEDKAKGHPLALRDMEYALKLNPNAAAIHYFQGYLWKMMGDLARAKTYFKRCVELDPRHIDAQRELRMMK